ncbi:hypothetical protein OFN32_31685, partial [Escherichia coli]|nr:hypothetical protein [Escherichia coli]
MTKSEFFLRECSIIKLPYIKSLQLMKNYLLNVFTLAVAVISFPLLAQNSDPLPSWNDGQTKQAIIQFVSDVTDANS